MRIISRFKDYYDSAMAYGQDQSVIFHREETEIPHRMDGRYRIYPIYLNYTDGGYFNKFHLKGQWSGKQVILLHTGSVAFCGKVWNFVCAERHSRNEVGIPSVDLTFIYDHEALIQYTIDNDAPFDRKDSIFFRKEKFENHYRNWFLEQGTERFREKLIEDRVVIASTHHFVNEYSGVNRKFVFNGSLAEIQFFRVMDAFTAYQEIDMWIGGVLPHDGPPLVEVSNKDKIHKHGFDNRSFKKEPTKKR